jgi:hypothetical protein
LIARLDSLTVVRREDLRASDGPMPGETLAARPPRPAF